MSKPARRQLTADDLSLLLGEHDAGNLYVGGMYAWGVGAGWPSDSRVGGSLMQVVLNDPSPTGVTIFHHAWESWFDANYLTDWNADEFLTVLEAVDMVGPQYAMGPSR